MQESDTTVNGNGISGYSGCASSASQCSARFTRFVVPGGLSGYHLYEGGGLLVIARECEFYGGQIGYANLAMQFTNCLFARCGISESYGSYQVDSTFYNCTLWGGSLSLNQSYYQNNIAIVGCAFDGVSLSITPSSYYSIFNWDYNAYASTTTLYPSYNGGHDQLGVTFKWLSSWLGNFYLPTNSPLINTGSTTANLLGLYHFTTQTNQLKETNSIVDIGYHYVAVDANGVPIDTNGNGIPDYLDDANGNGLVDSGEIGWLNI